MSEIKKTYAAIDLKSFYASVECAARHLDPLKTNLIVADTTRTEKTICLAVSPTLKAYGIPGRPRLFEVVQKVEEINAVRSANAPGGKLLRTSVLDEEIRSDPTVALGYLVASPRMLEYMNVSTRIYEIYKRYISPEDIHVYSIDEVFIDITQYIGKYGTTPERLVEKMISDVFEETGITATAGIGDNLFLAKVAMDIVAKHKKPDARGVRIASLSETGFREQLWDHKPLTDFWGIGKGYVKRLASLGLETLGDIALCSVSKERFYNIDTLYKTFGVNAEILIDHAWGYEACGIADIKIYRPKNNSLSIGQVLKEPYNAAKTEIIVKEMADSLGVSLAEKGLETDRISLYIGYDSSNTVTSDHKYETETDRYGKTVPKAAHGYVRLKSKTALSSKITAAAKALFGRIYDERLYSRRINIVAENVTFNNVFGGADVEQVGLFTDDTEDNELGSVQSAVMKLNGRYGKNTVLKAIDYEDGATTIERNGQIGGHKS
ncbi:MAG: DNA methylase [Firmicutes bacterium]|nr:DNA methylase [Candidatus Colimorpha enterica]